MPPDPGVRAALIKAITNPSTPKVGGPMTGTGGGQPMQQVTDTSETRRGSVQGAGKPRQNPGTPVMKNVMVTGPGGKLVNAPTKGHLTQEEIDYVKRTYARGIKSLHLGPKGRAVVKRMSG